MLKLTNLIKIYKTSSADVKALKGINLDFRNNEFVAILGPSGCGKTTLLNIVGGLDHATDGELFIDGVSTKNFKDRDWDTYRNERIGFVFQSYNLIPHQSVLENVELALRISGLKKEERIKKSLAILDRVGLAGEYNKKPNQLSGGQCQRVAIARALVNDPEILLADEPTGALDTKTSIQIMDLLKEVAKDRLVIMVTHNPELANAYASRIINLKDGEVIGDSNPYQEVAADIKPYEPRKKSFLPLLSCFGLSWRNLLSKGKRTAMVCLAGSIGIIGVGAVSAVSSGVQDYINAMEVELLSCNPVSVSKSALNLTGAMNMVSSLSQAGMIIDNTSDGVVNVDGVITSLVESATSGGSSFMVQNDITRRYVDFINQMPEEYYSAIQYDYGEDISKNIFTNVTLEGLGTVNMSLYGMLQMYQSMVQTVGELAYMSGLISELGSIEAMPGDETYIMGQYDILGEGHFPKNENEIVLVLNTNGSLSDLLLTQFGYYTQEEFFNRIYGSLPGGIGYDEEQDKNSFTFEELMGKEFTYYSNEEIYVKETDSRFNYVTRSDSSMNGTPLKISAILRLKEGLTYGTLSSGFYCTQALVDHMREEARASEIATYLDSQSDDTFIYSEGSDAGVYFSYDFYVQGNYFQSGNLRLVDAGNIITNMVGGTSNIQTLSLSTVGAGKLPIRIRFYTEELKQKDDLTHYLNLWNEDISLTIAGVSVAPELRDDIIYTDDLSIAFSMLGSMISIVTAALIAFTALSLLVSTVMIAIITYVSVIERVKEIGVIRSLGGRKKDVSRLFNAETALIGLLAGVFGVIFTYVITLIINVIVAHFTGVGSIAALPWWAAILLVFVSIILTSISGLIPAKIAAKKDPVVALRTE